MSITNIILIQFVIQDITHRNDAIYRFQKFRKAILRSNFVWYFEAFKS